MICTLCKASHTAAEIDEETMKLCINRARRRKYATIKKHKPGKWYVCPTCKKRVEVWLDE